ncbi:hypothetical protein GBF38_007047 [Nibea albiflora]|uniref:Uncharacterized protein n=1 Tax=Nibea albiflora TaxID=240163 RepID=A0ACB7EKM7_NIBAL|nr:hypothetical protein GBF38_007047 [Nibea albiflora]
MDRSSYLDEALRCMAFLPLNHLESKPKSDEKNDKSDPQAIKADSMASLHLDEACPEKRTSTPFFSREDFLQVNHEELQVADVISEEKFPNELQVEKNKNNLLQEELERICISYQLLIARYEDDVLRNREQTDALRRDLDNEILQKKQLQSQFDEATAALQEERQNLEREVEQKKLLRTAYEELQEKHKVDQAKNNTLQQEVDSLQHEIHNLRAEKEALHQKMAEEMTILQQNVFFKEKIFVRELDELKAQLSIQISLNLKLSTELKAEREAPQKITSHDDNCADEPCQHQESIHNTEPLERTKEAELSEEMPCHQQQETISPALTLELQQGAEGTLPQTRAEPPSVWKRVRHFLGLRKPKRWKRRREEE